MAFLFLFWMLRHNLFVFGFVDEEGPDHYVMSFSISFSKIRIYIFWTADMRFIMWVGLAMGNCHHILYSFGQSRSDIHGDVMFRHPIHCFLTR